MKIHQISLHNYNQFRNLEIDLRYPLGHPKEGQALEKVCFIGQSGTGKTSLLRLIKYYISLSRLIGTNVFLPDIENDKVKMTLSYKDYLFTRTNRYTLPNFNISNLKGETSEEWIALINKDIDSLFSGNEPFLLNFPAERLVNKNINSNLESDEAYNNTIDQRNYSNNNKTGTIIDFALENNTKYLKSFLTNIRNHREEELSWLIRRNNVAKNLNINVAEIQKINAEYNDWLIKNPDPLNDLASKLGELLAGLGVKIKTDIDKDAFLQINDILLQTLEGVTLERNFWSTGTKQIVDTAMPLFEIKPKNAIVLIDEPERSLYPNMQQKVVDFYTGLGNNCQFFFATHSPIIASAFDPWEIVELKFDNTNSFVEQELHYTGERHIDNYTVYPKYLKWDAILMKLFDLTEEGNSSVRTPELMRAAVLRRELDSLKANGQNKDATFKEKLDKFIKLQTKLGWDEKA